MEVEENANPWEKANEYQPRHREQLVQGVLRQEDLGVFQKLKEKQCAWKVVRKGKCGVRGGWKVDHGSKLHLVLNTGRCFILC